MPARRCRPLAYDERAASLATITSKRQLTLPTAVITSAGLHPGDELHPNVVAGGVIRATRLGDVGRRREQLLKDIKRAGQGGHDGQLIGLIAAFVGAGGIVAIDAEDTEGAS